MYCTWLHSAWLLDGGTSKLASEVFFFNSCDLFVYGTVQVEVYNLTRVVFKYFSKTRELCLSTRAFLANCNAAVPHSKHWMLTRLSFASKYWMLHCLQATLVACNFMSYVAALHE